MTVRIMHLSDLHLGNDIVLRALLRGRPWWKRVDASVTKGLTDTIRSLKPHYIVISGDFVNKPKSGMFQIAASYIRNLCLASGFDLQENLLVVPGNHDASFFPQNQSDDFRRLRLYREFLRILFAESDIEARRQRYVKVDSARMVIFVCLDSTLKNNAPLAEGEIGETQRTWMKRKMSEISQELGSAYADYAKVAVIHHHCVPIEGTPPSSERFMQLLDAGDVLKSFDEVGINCVLHGHKHVPHVTRRTRDDSTTMTVVGSGSTTCPFLEEQHSWGNNFQLIEIHPEKNEMSALMYKADSSGRFQPVGEPKPFSLFRTTSLGYEWKHTKKVVTVADDGTTKVTIVRRGLRIVTPGKTMKSLPLRLFVDVPGAKITDFECDSRDVEVQLTVDTTTLKDGNLILMRPMTYGSPATNITFSYLVSGGTAMSKKDLTTMYPKPPERESTIVTVVNPLATLELELNLPRKFPSRVEPKLEHLGARLGFGSLLYAFEANKSLNRWTLKVKNPPLGYRVILEWDLPDSWPLS